MDRTSDHWSLAVALRDKRGMANHTLAPKGSCQVVTHTTGDYISLGRVRAMITTFFKMVGMCNPTLCLKEKNESICKLP